MSNRLPGISVLLPVLMRDVSIDSVGMLREAIRSVASQTEAGALEIILIDDGSQIPVEALKDELGPEREVVRWVRLKHNRGIVFALNEGLRLARHDLIGRIDADDCWLPGKLREQMELFANDDDLSIVATGMTRVDESGKFIDEHIRPGDWKGILNFFVEGGCPFPHGSVVAKKQVFRLLGGYSHAADVQHCEDYALWGTWLRFFKPAMVEQALYQYRVSKSSVSSQHESAQSIASRSVREKFASLNLTDSLPQALYALARCLDCTVTDAGVVAYTMWQYGACLALPEAAREPLGVIMPDRLVARGEPVRHWQSLFNSVPDGAADKLVGLVARPY